MEIEDAMDIETLGNIPENILENIYDPDLAPPMGYGHEVTPSHPDYCPPISNMVAMGEYIQAGSRELRAAELYAPNVSSGKGQFPANACRNDYATLLLYPTTGLMIGAPTEAVGLYRFKRFMATLATIPFPLYDPVEVAKARSATCGVPGKSIPRSRRKEGTTFSEADALSHLSSEHVIGQAPLGTSVRIRNIKIRNVVVVGRLADWGLDLARLFAAYPTSTYDPDNFPGLKLAVPIAGTSSSPAEAGAVHKTVAINVFSSNRGLLIGNVSLPEVAEAFKTAKKMVAPFTDAAIPDTASGRNIARLQSFQQYLSQCPDDDTFTEKEHEAGASLQTIQQKFQAHWFDCVARM